MAPTAMPAPTPTPAVTCARWRVLVVDDEPAIGRMIQTVLGHHDVEVVSSGESALARLRVDHAFDVIVCDLMMPTVTGKPFTTGALEAAMAVTVAKTRGA